MIMINQIDISLVAKIAWYPNKQTVTQAHASTQNILIRQAASSYGHKL